MFSATASSVYILPRDICFLCLFLFISLFSMQETNSTCRSIHSPILPMTFPIVKAARTVPIPSPLICPRKVQVIKTVNARQDTSKQIFTLE